MRSRVFEIIFIVSFLFIVIYFLLYKFHFDVVCEKYTGERNLEITEVLQTMWWCADSYVCYNNNIEYDTSHRNVVDWNCSKKTVDYFETDFYSDKFYNIKNQIFK